MLTLREVSGLPIMQAFDTRDFKSAEEVAFTVVVLDAFGGKDFFPGTSQIKLSPWWSECVSSCTLGLSTAADYRFFSALQVEADLGYPGGKAKIIHKESDIIMAFAINKVSWSDLAVIISFPLFHK